MSNKSTCLRLRELQIMDQKDIKSRKLLQINVMEKVQTFKMIINDENVYLWSMKWQSVSYKTTLNQPGLKLNLMLFLRKSKRQSSYSDWPQSSAVKSPPLTFDTQSHDITFLVSILSSVQGLLHNNTSIKVKSVIISVNKGREQVIQLQVTCGPNVNLVFGEARGAEGGAE